jgi:hypothetical protein
MQSWSRSRTLVARILPTLAIIVVAFTAAGTAASAAGGAGGAVKLLGAPALMDRADASDTSPHQYAAAVRVVNSSHQWQAVSVRFDAMKGSKVVHSATAKQTVQPGEGLALLETMKMEGGLKSVRARIVGVARAPADAVLASFKLLGKPMLIEQGNCSWTARVENPGGVDAAIPNDLFFVGLLRGKIVSSGRAPLVFDVKAHTTTTVEESYEPCVKKMDVVRAYFQNA